MSGPNRNDAGPPPATAPGDPSAASPSERLVHLAAAILDEWLPASAVGPEITALAGLLRAHATVHIDPAQASGDGETRTACGLAISPTLAGRCADDLARTAVFLRGLHRAIDDARSLRPDRPVRVLYAGCGPYALLAVPLMALAEPTALRVTLLDIHPASIDSARAVVEAFGLGAIVDGYETVDACAYRVPPDRVPDVVVSETMNVCLEKEPQVAIVRHLLSQAPAAALVPAEVRVDACLVDASKEFRFVEPGERVDHARAARDRVVLGPVFELSAETTAGWVDTGDERLPAHDVRIPDPLERRYTPMLLTSIVVHRDHVLRSYDSGLTIPKPIPVDGPLRGGETLSFHYRLGPRPGLVCRVASG